MKSRLSSTIWGLVFFVGLALFGVLGLAYYAGAHSVAQAGADGSAIPGGGNGALVGAAVLALIPLLSSNFFGPMATALMGGITSATVSWTAPANNGSTITDYKVYYSTNGTTWTLFNDGVSTATSATVGMRSRINASAAAMADAAST